MARKARVNRSPEFKAKVAVAAIQGLKTSAQLSSIYGVNSIQISQWKSQLLAGAAGVFAQGVPGGIGASQAQLVSELYEQIGRQNMELEWLKKKVSRLG
jgi:transposase-like protein